MRWVGLDKSVYAVVKTSIIAQMLKMGADVDAILQVREEQSFGFRGLSLEASGFWTPGSVLRTHRVHTPVVSRLIHIEEVV